MYCLNLVVGPIKRRLALMVGPIERRLILMVGPIERRLTSMVGPIERRLTLLVGPIERRLTLIFPEEFAGLQGLLDMNLNSSSSERRLLRCLATCCSTWNFDTLEPVVKCVKISALLTKIKSLTFVIKIVIPLM